MQETFYTKSYGEGIYAVSHPQWAKPVVPGGAIMQTWVIEGKDKVMAIDSPMPEIAGFREYLEQEFKKTVMMVLSHGHADHTGCNKQFDEVYLSKRDWPLLLGDGFTPKDSCEGVEQLPYRLLELYDNSQIDLGKRAIRCIPVAGHTPGSMLFYDVSTYTLFSGDSVARRILYGLSGWTPLRKYLDGLKALENYKREKVYSMHDDFALPGNMPEKIIRNITENIFSTELIWQPPGSERVFLRILSGEGEKDPEFFDFVIPKDAVECKQL